MMAETAGRVKSDFVGGSRFAAETAFHAGAVRGSKSSPSPPVTRGVALANSSPTRLLQALPTPSA